VDIYVQIDQAPSPYKNELKNMTGLTKFVWLNLVDSQQHTLLNICSTTLTVEVHFWHVLQNNRIPFPTLTTNIGQNSMGVKGRIFHDFTFVYNKTIKRYYS
jgi:hypothetical protein